MSEVLVEVWRGAFLECQHRGHAVVVNSNGDIFESWGNP
ncbi:asparaginase, partial [Amylibacter sp.]|nr:asparaginase [Amylibacter sp.]